MKRFVIFVVVILFLFFPVFNIKADEYADVTKELEVLQRLFDDIKRATDTNEAQLSSLQKQLDDIKVKVEVLEGEITKKEKEVKDGEAVLSYQKNLLNERARSYYKNIGKGSFSLIGLIVAENLSESVQNFFLQKSLIDEDRKTIVKIVLYIKGIEDKKASLETEKSQLAVIKADIDNQTQFLASEVAKAKVYQSELSTKIAQLSTRQQELIAAKLASLNIPRSAGTSMGGCVPDLDKDPGFSPRFAFFTFGVPNRTGLNQWGAFGRAKADQKVEEILRAYYNFDSLQDFDANINVNDGNGINTGNIIWSGSLEDYVKRIYEVPEDWPSESLKAQAIAARSYVLAATSNGRDSICANENCQVFKTNPKTGAWIQAVDGTNKKVMVKDGSPIKAWFSSTHGGYILKSGELPGWSDTSWTKHASDTRESVSSIDDLRDSNKAYDKESPWFYCDWGSRTQYNKTAWLKSEEVADIANVILLVKRDSSTGENLYQVDKPNPAGKETWDFNRVKQELRNRNISPFNNVDNISISADASGGKTNNITINGDAGSAQFDGKEFKDFFNLRAPSNIQIVGPLYNAEKR